MLDSKIVDIQESAGHLINQFAIILRTAHIHSTDNIAFINTAQKFMDLLNEMFRAEDIELQLRGDFFYINDERVRYSPRYILNFDYLSEEFRKIELGTVHFKKDLDLQEVKFFIYALVECDFMRKTYDHLADKMSEVSTIELRKLEEVIDEDTGDARKIVRKTYFKAVFYMKGVINKLKADEEVDMRRAKRVVTSIVNTIVEHEQTLIGMTSIKDYDEYTYYHCTNVSILAAALGQRLGLNRSMLVDLGIAALFHDLGKIEVPYEILNKPSNLVEAEWRIMKKHPTWGVKALLKMRDIDQLSMRAAFVAFEHHLNINLSGYPGLRNATELDFFSNIVSIADRYDAMTASRVYSKNPMSYDRALSVLVEAQKNLLHPVLVKFFVNMVGVYPIGSLVKLDTQELALIFENNEEDLFRPRVMLITDSQGKLQEGQVVDLSEKNEEDLFIRNILHVLDPKEFGINIADYLL